MNLFSNLTPKTIVLKAIADKLKPFGVEKVMLLFKLESSQYNISIANTSGQSMKIDITEDEISTIKKLFISKIEKAWKMKYDIEPKDIICTIDLKDENDIKLEIFILDEKQKPYKFDF